MKTLKAYTKTFFTNLILTHKRSLRTSEENAKTNEKNKSSCWTLVTFYSQVLSTFTLSFEHFPQTSAIAMFFIKWNKVQHLTCSKFRSEFKVPNSQLLILSLVEDSPLWCHLFYMFHVQDLFWDIFSLRYAAGFYFIVSPRSFSRFRNSPWEYLHTINLII